MITDAVRAVGRAVIELGNLRTLLVGGKNLLSELEVDRIKKELRIVYFEEDNMLKDVNALILGEPSRSEVLMSLKRKLDQSEQDAQRAVDILLSHAVRTNLRLENATIRQLRNAADIKLDVRRQLRKFIDDFRPSSVSADLMGSLLDLRRKIVELNSLLDEMEIILKAKGLQRAEEVAPSGPATRTKKATPKSNGNVRRPKSSARNSSSTRSSGRARRK